MLDHWDTFTLNKNIFILIDKAAHSIITQIPINIDFNLNKIMLCKTNFA